VKDCENIDLIHFK